MKAFMIRVEAEDFDGWKRVHDSCREARSAFGMTDGPFYVDAADSSAALVQLNVEDVDRAKEWFRSEAFKQANSQVKLRGPRELWVAEAGTPVANRA
jgi:hypothetical protein